VKSNRVKSCGIANVLMALLLGSVAPYLSAANWNSPYSQQGVEEQVLYSSFSGRPKHLDPARSYSSNEYTFIGQIYEPPLQYHYLKRPYQLEPLGAAEMPVVTYLDRQGEPLPADASTEQIAYSVYEIRVREGAKYQPHPAFVPVDEVVLEQVEQLSDFPQQGSRALMADDYIYQIKRLAHPATHSPIFGLMTEYIVGLQALRDQLKEARKQHPEQWLDLRKFPLDGVERVDDRTYRIKVKGKYPQFLYWLAMPFFAPMPWEVEQFYERPQLKEKNITLDWYPVGSGPFMLTVNNPNRKMVLERNPNYHADFYPTEGEPEDREQGLLADAGQPIPFLDRIEFSLEKETIPYWNKFLQGYYDASGISSDSFDQAVQLSGSGEAQLTPDMEAQGMRLQTSVSTSIYYMGFNMADTVIGGTDERARKLRQAISIAVDYEEYISIFANGRGIPAQSPLPAGIFGHQTGEQGVNPVVYRWESGKPVRRSLDEAKQLLVEAGYPNGRDAESGKPLTLYFDVTASGPDDKARMDWYRKQFEKIDLQLVIRNTDYNRFQDKMLNGSAQIYLWGWNADYPDPENFLFLLYGPNAKMEKNGENASNYSNPQFDQLFEQMKNMENSPERQQVIEKMTTILHNDAPWLWGFHPKNFGLYHHWYRNTKPNLMANNTLKYARVDSAERTQKRGEWNQPVLWPLWGGVVLMMVLIVPAWLGIRRREQQSLRKEVS
jgi:ABC-type transport system substrate-binding protein